MRLVSTVSVPKNIALDEPKLNEFSVCCSVHRGGTGVEALGNIITQEEVMLQQVKSMQTITVSHPVETEYPSLHYYHFLLNHMKTH